MRAIKTITISILTVGLLLALGIVILGVIPLAFPPWDAASFFSSSLVADPVALDFVALYIPSNPFESLANNVVPAAVLFSILLGVGLSAIPGKAGLLHALDQRHRRRGRGLEGAAQAGNETRHGSSIQRSAFRCQPSARKRTHTRIGFG